MTARHGQLVGLVADPFIVGDGDPAAPPDLGQPLRIRRIGGKVIAMPLHEQTGLAQTSGKLLAEIPIREERVPIGSKTGCPVGRPATRSGGPRAQRGLLDLACRQSLSLQVDVADSIVHAGELGREFRVTGLG